MGRVKRRNGRQQELLAKYLAIGIVVTSLLLITAQPNPSQQTCPQTSEISPCACQVKKNGLDILCEATDVIHITRAMTALKPRSPIIFYLKLRHNTLPKLQGFIFLALDIRHLTIHNSSLAVIEETSLSSLGEFALLIFLHFIAAHLHSLWIIQKVYFKGLPLKIINNSNVCLDILWLLLMWRENILLTHWVSLFSANSEILLKKII